MAKKRGGFGGWLSRLSGWQLIVSFLLAALSLGTSVLVSVSKFERAYGIGADWLGHATVKGVKAELAPLAEQGDRAFLWQLYNTSRALNRQIDDLKARKNLTLNEQETLAKLVEQRTEVLVEYDDLKKDVAERKKKKKP